MAAGFLGLLGIFVMALGTCIAIGIYPTPNIVFGTMVLLAGIAAILLAIDISRL